jgi:tRNA pseudouridine55 synthase
LEVPAHLSALRRIASGSFRIEDAVSLASPDLPTRLRPLSPGSAVGLGWSTVNANGTRAARLGQSLTSSDFIERCSAPVSIWADELGRPIAIGLQEEDGLFRVARGFHEPPSLASAETPAATERP